MTRVRRPQPAEQAPRTVSRPGDAAERQADRAADVVARGGSVTGWSFADARATAVHRQETGKPKTNEDKLKEGAEKAAEAALKTEAGQALTRKVLDDPLVKAATSFLDTTPGKVVAGGVAATGVGVLAATGKPLPVQPPKIPLDAITPGLSAEVTYEGPVNAPTFVGLSITYAEQGPKKDKGPSRTEGIAADTARLRAQQELFRPKAEKDQQRADEQAAAVAYMLARQRAQLGTTTLVPLLPGTQPKSVPIAPTVAPVEEQKDDAAPVQREAAAGAPGAAFDTSGVEEAVASPGRPIDAPLRRSMESRFGYDFSAVRLHEGGSAATTAADLAATAFTVGDDIVLGTSAPDADTPQGRHLLAHELAHVVQQRDAGTGTAAPLRVHRRSVGEWLGIFFGTEEGNWSDQELRSYLTQLTTRNAIDGAFDADNKARAIVRKWKAGTAGWDLTGAQKGLLIDEMIDGPTLDDDEQAILDLLELSDAGDLRRIFKEPAKRVGDLDDDFHGEEHRRLVAFLARRFKGGIAALKKGDVTVIGDAVPAGVPSFAFDESRLEQRLDGDDTAADIVAVIDKLSPSDRAKALDHLLHRSLPSTTSERGRVAQSYFQGDDDRKAELKDRLVGLNTKLRKLKAILPRLLLADVPATEADLRTQTSPLTDEQAKAAKEALVPQQFEPLDDDVIDLDDPADTAAPTTTTPAAPAKPPAPKSAAEKKAEAAKKKKEAEEAKEKEKAKHGPESDYRKAIQAEISTIIENTFTSKVTDLGTHAGLDQIEPMALPAKNATDEVFGAFYDASKHPAMTTRDSGRQRANLRSWHSRFTARIGRLTPRQQVDTAFEWILYYYQSETKIRLINDQYDAEPRFTEAGQPKNVAAKTLVLIARELVKDGVSADALDNPRTVADKLLATKRNWGGMASGRNVFVDLYLPADKDEARLARWEMLQTLIHEYIHTLVADAYEKYAKSFGDNSVEWNTLIEGVDEVFTLMVWAHLAPKATDPDLRKAVEGEKDAELPALDIPNPSTYDSYAEAIRLTSLVGIRNLIAAYFVGLVDRIRGATGTKGKRP